jgi:hypothetical protein
MMKTVFATALIFGLMGGAAQACFPNCSDAQSRAWGAQQQQSPYDQGHAQGIMQQQLRQQHLMMLDQQRRTNQQFEQLNHQLRNMCGVGMRC